MVATCVIEVILLIYTVIRYKMTTLTRLTVATLALLALFQLCEFHVCRSGWIAGTWSRVGFIAITMLPPLGIHIIQNNVNAAGEGLLDSKRSINSNVCGSVWLQ